MWKSTCFACLKTGSDWNFYLQKENGNFRTVALQALVKLPWELNLDEAEKQGKSEPQMGFSGVFQELLESYGVGQKRESYT